MKNNKYIALIFGLFLAGTAYVAADDCPCEGGTAPYQYDCDEDGILDSCLPCQDSCGTTGVASSPDKECCGGEEYSPTSECCEDGVVLQGECPEITGLVATDSSAGTRSSSDNLQMVLTGGARSATIELSTSGTMLPGYPKWSGSGVSGADGASVATYNGSSGGNVTAYVSSSKSKSVNISIVDENEKVVSLSVSDVGAVDELASRSNGLLDFLAQGMSTKVVFGGSLSGTTKIVDYYGDGEQVGKYQSLTGAFSADLASFSVESPPIPVTAGVVVRATAGFSAGTAQMTIQAAYDESKVNPWVNLTGGFSFNQNASFGVKLVVGYICYAEYVASLNAYVGGDFSNSGKVIYLTPSGSVGPVIGTLNVGVQVFGVGCTIYTSSHTMYDGLYSFESSPITIYEIN